MSNPMGSNPGAAVCASHSDRPAERTCDRCGGYMCTECSDGGMRGTCPECQLRSGFADFPIARESWSFDAVFSLAWARWKPEWLMVSVGALILMGVSMIFSIVSQIVQFGFASSGSVELTVGVSMLISVAQTLIQGAIQLGFYLFCFDVLMGRPANLGLLFTQFGKIGKLFVQLLVAGLLLLIPLAVYAGIIAGVIFGAGLQDSEGTVIAIIGVATLLALFPLVWVGLGFSFMQMELALDDQVGPVEAMKRSFALVSGERLGTFAVAFVSSLVAGLGLLACGIGIIVSAGLAQVILATLYLALRNGSSLPSVERTEMR